METWPWGHCCGVVALGTWPWGCSCGVVALGTQPCSYGVVAMAVAMVNTKAVGGWWWGHGRAYGVVAMGTWPRQWGRGHGTEPKLWSGSSGAMAIPTR